MGPPDLISCLFEASCSFNRRPFRPPALHWALQSGPPKMALYSLTGWPSLHFTLNQHKLANYGLTGTNPDHFLFALVLNRTRVLAEQ
jgi:hypothetical protein